MQNANEAYAFRNTEFDQKEQTERELPNTKSNFV